MRADLDDVRRLYGGAKAREDEGAARAHQLELEARPRARAATRVGGRAVPGAPRRKGCARGSRATAGALGRAGVDGRRFVPTAAPPRAPFGAVAVCGRAAAPSQPSARGPRGMLMAAGPMTGSGSDVCGEARDG